jgi:hypothetical protein
LYVDSLCVCVCLCLSVYFWTPGEPTRIQEDPNGKTFTVSSSVTFQVTREDDGANIVCSVNHESLKGADRSTSQRIEVLCMSWAWV